MQWIASSNPQVISEDVAAARPPDELVKADARNSLVINEKELGLINASNTEETETFDPKYPPPTELELATLRKVPGSIPWITWLLCLVEFAERASYYGAKQVFVNFLANKLPPGNFKACFRR